MGLRIALALSLLAGGALVAAPLPAQTPAVAAAVQSSPGFAAAFAPAAIRLTESRRAPGSISGKVTDAKTGEPLAAAGLKLGNTELGGVTGEDGTYHIARVPAGTYALVVRRIGYAPETKQITMTEDGAITADFQLRVSATELQAIVVTGTAGNQTREAQGAPATSIDAADINSKAAPTNVTDVLQGRVAGVNVTSAGGTIGAAPRIQIRGPASISLSNAPLVFIDGVRVESGSRQDVGGYHGLEGLGGQTVTALNDLNPDDIASIEIVKGPAAATLYGADASAGVIQIITKSGQLGSHRFTQNIGVEYDQVKPNFTPIPVFGTCSAGQTAPGGPDLCQGQAPGTVVSANPLVDGGVFRNGNLKSLDYSARGGGDSFGYFVSGSVSNELGTSASNYYYRRTGRSSFNWVVNPKLSLDAAVGLAYNDYRLPQGDDGNYGYLTQGYFESSVFAVTVNPDGTRSGGTSTPIEGLEAIQNKLTTLRFTPTATAHYNPFSWLTNRLTIGGDLSSTEGFTFFPKNDQNWYSGDQANGYVEDVQNPIHIYTIDYLGDVKLTFGSNGHIASDLSFGSQYINTTTNYLAGVGIGLADNSSNLVSSAASSESHQTFAESKSLGFLAQEGLAFGQTLFLQLGARVDKNSSFGQDYGAFFLPKVGASYVMSQEPFWQSLSPVVSTFRLRAAYGTTGRAPDPGASLRTYAPFPFVTPTGGVGPGLVQASPGNPNLKPERGTEFEAGFDAGFFQDRVGVELTYFDKKTKDLLLLDPLAPSLAFTADPFVNAGSVDNRGLELLLRATPISNKTATWDVTFTANTLRNRLLSLGDLAIPDRSEISPDLTLRYAVGRPLSAWYSSKIIKVDTAAGFATVTNTPVFDAPQFPTFQANFANTVTLFHNLRLYASFSGQSGAKILNLTPLLQDLTFTSAGTNLPAGKGGYTKEQFIERFGPFQTADGTPVSLVLDHYLQPTDFIRLQELSATLSLPNDLAARLHASSASLTLAGRNLALWKSSKFTGVDPEMLSNTQNGGSLQFATTEEFTVPQSRRFIVRLNLEF
jgi:TonB-linked SusC/RagA family outer membrane protein